jgi:hypothetical protein
VNVLGGEIERPNVLAGEAVRFDRSSLSLRTLRSSPCHAWLSQVSSAGMLHNRQQVGVDPDDDPDHAEVAWTVAAPGMEKIVVRGTRERAQGAGRRADTLLVRGSVRSRAR